MDGLRFSDWSFAHSGGLETYTQAEVIRTPLDLARLITAKLESAASTDLIIVHTAMAAYLAGDRRQIQHLASLCSASKPARETREASEKIGKRLLSSILNLISDDLLTFYRIEIDTKRCAGHRAWVGLCRFRCLR